MSVGSASLFGNGKMALNVAASNILLACQASIVSKLIITWTLNRGRYAFLATALLMPMLAAFVAAWLLI